MWNTCGTISRYLHTVLSMNHFIKSTSIGRLKDAGCALRDKQQPTAAKPQSCYELCTISVN